MKKFVRLTVVLALLLAQAAAISDFARDSHFTQVQGERMVVRTDCVSPDSEVPL